MTREIPLVSVVLCTHNPRADYLQRVLAALRAQALPASEWEFLLIDNASREPVAASCDFSWHPRGRVVREEEIGLTAARLRGIGESTADLLLFVDDDNLLAADYLGQGLDIAEQYPFLGAWGGQVIPEFEVQPAEDVRPFLRYLLIREFDEVRWSNQVNFHETTPCGAGMWIRRTVAKEYAGLVASDPRRRELGRKGQLIFAGEDSDMALCSRRLSFGMGLFPQLKLGHLIPQKRLQPDFFLKAAFGGGYSFTLLSYLHGLTSGPQETGALRRMVRLARTAGLSRFERQLAAQEKKGELLAWSAIKKWEG